ncbi:prevent-host-death protein [Spirochaetia bacterium]|nr:prevent-host-death protein [Spirochaetia bacterium]
MPAIRKSADLRNAYGEISEFCHKYREPVFITKNGEGDLAVMSIETYETLSGKNELYQLIQEGKDDIKNGRTLTKEEIIKNIESTYGGRKSSL